MHTRVLAPFDTLPWGVLNVVDERETDLIVMGVSRAGFAPVSEHMPWVLAREIVRYVACPVLSVRS